MIEQQRVYRIKDLDSLLVFLREDLCWDLPDASIDDVSFEWTGLDLNLSEDVNKKLKDGLIRQLQPFATHQPWGIFVVEFATREVSIITLRQILRCFVAKRRGARPDLPAWQCENLLFICLYGENGFTFAHFKGDKPYFSKLTTFSWHPGEPVRTVCEFNLPALVYDDTWTPEIWAEEWQKAFDVEKVNKDFYRQIARFYYRLTGKEGQKRELVLPYVGDDSGSISIYEEFAVRLIGRTIFCWFLKHKESENDVPLIPPEALSLDAAQETEDFYHSMLEPLFFEVMNKRINKRNFLAIPRSEIIPFLNGGLFEQHPSDFYPGVANYGLKIPDAWFIDFFTLLERYNFTITENSSIDVDVAVDPEMLGRIFENLLAEVVPETGETARKATGSYYTPRAIVDYMVEQSLEQYLLTKTAFGEEKVNRLLGYGEDIEDFSTEEKMAAVTALKEIKVIDPACGSGAFLMGILHRMLAVLEKVDPRLELWRAQYLKSLDGIVRQTVEKNISRENWAYIRKLMIIRDSIYGVDIQPIAVEIAKLRCFLSLVVDEIILDHEENRGIEPLPNLEFKFVAANTLIGLPSRVERQGAFGVSDIIKKLKELREAYLRSFGAEKAQIEKEFNATQRKLFEENVQWLLNDAHTRQLAEWDPFSYESCGWFDSEWMFGVSGGFDIVIANPPYISYYSRQAKKIDSAAIEYYQRSYSFLKNSRKKSINTVMLFLEKALDLLALNATFAYIIDIGFFEKVYKEIREYVSQFNICEIVTNLSAFENVASGQLVIISKKENVPNFKCIVKNDFQVTNMFLSREDFNKNTVNISFLEKDTVGDMKDTILLGKICRITCGLEYGALRYMFLSREKKDERYHKVVNGGVSLPLKYCLRWNKAKNGYVLFDKYFEQELVEKGLNVSKTGKVVHLISGDEEKYKEEKLLIRQSATEIVGAFDDEGYYALRSLFVCNLIDSQFSLKYILALLNSKFITYYSQVNGVIRYAKGKQPQIRVEGLKGIPIRELQKRDQKPFVEIVERIQEITRSDDYLSKSDEKVKAEDYMEQIDQMVYELYGLTP